MSKYDIFAISMSNLVELGPILHSLWHMFPVRLILSGVLVVVVVIVILIVLLIMVIFVVIVIAIVVAMVIVEWSILMS